MEFDVSPLATDVHAAWNQTFERLSKSTKHHKCLHQLTLEPALLLLRCSALQGSSFCSLLYFFFLFVFQVPSTPECVVLFLTSPLRSAEWCMSRVPTPIRCFHFHLVKEERSTGPESNLCFSSAVRKLEAFRARRLFLFFLPEQETSCACKVTSHVCIYQMF